MNQSTKQIIPFVVTVIALFIISGSTLYAQGIGIPAKKWGVGIGNLPTFTGIRVNIVDKDIEKLTGINITAWISKPIEENTGTFSGLGIGLPMAVGTRDRFGISAAFFGVVATEHLAGINIGGIAVGSNFVSGINVGGLAAGAGESIKGINVGGFAVGAGDAVMGINIGGLAVGAGGTVAGINIAGLATGAGTNIMGLNVGGIAVGAGNNVSGFNVGGLVVGAGHNLTGFNASLLAIGAGNKLSGISFSALVLGAGGDVKGLNVAVIAAGSGTSLTGITVVGLAAGSPKLQGLTIATVAGSTKMTGIVIAPAYFRLKVDDGDEETPASMKGFSISAFNHIQGIQAGVTIGIFNYAHEMKGFQLGLINYIRSNPKGLRWLPIFNTNFGTANK